MDADPTLRHTFWTTVVGNYFGWLASCSVNHAMVQRCLALPTLKKAIMYINNYLLRSSLFKFMTKNCSFSLF